MTSLSLRIGLCGLLPLLAGPTVSQQDPVKPASPAKPRKPADWLGYRGSPALSGVAEGRLAGSYELAWSFETGDAITSSPVISDGVVYIGSNDGALYAIGLTTGKELWSYETKDMIEAPPLVHEGRIYVGSCDGVLYAFDKKGKLEWRFETGDKIMGAANWMRMPDGSTRILVGSYDNSLYCIDAGTGKKVWSYETDNYVNGTPAILGDRIVFGGCDAVLHVVSAMTGKAITKIELGDECHVAGSVGLADNKVFLGHYGNEFVCVDLETGKQKWRYPSRNHAFFSSPAIGKDRVVFGGRDKKLHCVDKETGKVIWAFPTKRKIDGSPVICGDKVVFGSGDGRVYLVSLADGKELWEYEIGRAIFSSPAVSGGMIVIGSNDKFLYAFKPAGKPAK